MASSYEAEISQQPEALRAFAADVLEPMLRRMNPGSYSRIIVTGMGSSHYAGLPTWRALVSDGHPAWWLSTSQLLTAFELVVPDSLLIVTSQSGRSGEVVALLEMLRGAGSPTIVGVTNDTGSPLADGATTVVALRAGTERAVSTKSYLNSLAAHQRLVGAFRGIPDGDCVRKIMAAADAVDSWPDSRPGSRTIGAAARRVSHPVPPGVALVGHGDDAATALWGGLVLKEAAGVVAEGYVGGEFRHGPIELAAAGLLTVVFSSSARTGAASMRRLAADLDATGRPVVMVTDDARAEAPHIRLPRACALVRLILGARVVQQLAVELAASKGNEPGVITVGNKTTTVV